MENITIKGNYAQVTLNPKIYPLKVLYSASYLFLDKAYIILDGNPEKEYLVKIEPKEGSPENMAKEFCNELVGYSDFLERNRDTKNLRENILKRALLTMEPEIEVQGLVEDVSIDDPEGIMEPQDESKQ